MRPTPPLPRLSVFGLVLLAGVGLAVALPRWLDGWVDAPRRLVQEALRGEDLESKRLAAHRCASAKRQIVRDVIGRRLSLARAIAELRELNRDWPDDPSPIRWAGHRLTEDERLGRDIIEAVPAALDDRPGEARGVVRRLERELEALRYRKGGPPDGGVKGFGLPTARGTRLPGPLSWSGPIGIRDRGLKA
jgi:hypothetical protein